MDFFNYFNIKSEYDKKRERREAYWGFVGANFGFIIDCLKVVFKPLPDADQGWFEFLFEKAGALALMLVCGGMLFLAFSYIIIPIFALNK